MNEPLVSIVVISYNSEEFIIEALESIKFQSYRNLEIIISDDGSTDSTVKIIDKWLDENNDRFIFSKLIKSDCNTGITANLNRGVKAIRGEYIKLMAADDILLENCITDLIEFAINGNHKFCFSKALPFSNDNDVTKLIEEDNRNYHFFFKKSQKDQLKSLLKAMGPLSFAIGGFYSKKVIKEVGYFDEKYEMMEDYPFFVNLSRMGYRFVFLNKYTSKYRIRNIANKNTFMKTKRYRIHYKNLADYRKDVVLPLMIKKKMYYSALYLVIVMFLLDIENKNNNVIYSEIMTILRKIKQRYMNLRSLIDTQKGEKNEN